MTKQTETSSSLEQILGEITLEININRMNKAEVITKYQNSLALYVKKYNLNNSQVMEITEIFCRQLHKEGLGLFSEEVNNSVAKKYPL